MKKLTTKMVTPVLALTVFVVLTTALAVTGREAVSGSGATTATGLTTFAGSATITIGESDPMTATLNVTLLGQIVSDEGVIHANVSHKFDFGNGNTFTTKDKAILEATGVPGEFTMNEKLVIDVGEGDFAGATGDLTVHGKMVNLFFAPPPVPPTGPPQATFNIRGAISR